MTTTKMEIKEEAINRINTLIEKCKLNPNVMKYFSEDKVYYSYLTAGGFMGSIDTISYDKNYEKAVKDFETKHPDCLVYHAIESITAHGKLLSLLYITKNQLWRILGMINENYKKIPYSVLTSDIEYSDIKKWELNNFYIYSLYGLL